MLSIIRPLLKAKALHHIWAPQVVGIFEDCYLKVAKIEGELVWHQHDEEDELFLVLEGQLSLQLPTQHVLVNPGEIFIVPKGLPHLPRAEKPCLLLLIEKRSTKHTGSQETPFTQSLLQQLRQQ